MLLNAQLSGDIMGGKMELLAGTGLQQGMSLITVASSPNMPILAIATDLTLLFAIPLMSILSLSNN